MAASAIEKIGELFDGIENAHSSGAGRYIVPGNYLATVQEIKTFESQQHAGRHYFCAEIKVDEYHGSEMVGEGETLTWLVDLSKQAALGNIREFVEALNPDVPLDGPEAKLVVAELCGPDQPASGMPVRCTALMITTKAGNPFTKVRFSAA